MQQQLATAPTDNPQPVRKTQTLAWTSAQEAYLRQRWADSATAAQIAEEIGFGATKNIVIGKANRLGLAARQTQPLRKGVTVLAQARAAAAPRATPEPARPRPVAKALAPIVAPPIRCEPVPEGGIEIHELERHHCRYPVAGLGAEMRYCGAGRLEGKAFAYCARHYVIAAVVTGSSRVEREIRAAMRGRG